MPGPGSRFMTVHLRHFLAPVHIELPDLFFDGHPRKQVFDAEVYRQVSILVRGDCNGLQKWWRCWHRPIKGGKDDKGKEQEATDEQGQMMVHVTSI